MKLRYIGPHDQVDVIDITVARGEPFEAVGKTADALLRQPDNFERVPVRKSKSKTTTTKTEA